MPRCRFRSAPPPTGIVRDRPHRPARLARRPQHAGRTVPRSDAPAGRLRALAAAVADLVADLTNRFTGMWFPSPALVQLEWNVVRWLADVFGYPAEARGVLTTGGSMANLSALVAALRAVSRSASTGCTVRTTNGRPMKVSLALRMKTLINCCICLWTIVTARRNV